MTNQRKTFGVRCNKCGGTYIWDDGERKCLMCGKPYKTLDTTAPPPIEQKPSRVVNNIGYQGPR